MKKNLIWQSIALLAIAAIFLTACGPAATQTTAPEATQPVAEQPTVAVQPTEAAAPAEPTQAEATTAPAAGEEFTFGMLLVGPYNDHGWSNAHYDAGLYVEQKLPGTKMIYVDKVNPADRPGTTPAQLAEDLVSKGAKLIIFNSDDMKDSATEFAQNNPDVPVIFASGDTVWKEGKNYIDLPNMTNIMGKMEIGKMIAGCSAALTTKTGKIGYLGPLINDETRRLVNSAYLGAKYCWTHYLGKDAADLSFKVTWIGFWFNIPGVTSDPTQVADEFFNGGYDVVLSGIDSTEALTEAGKFRSSGKETWAIPYDYVGACDEAPDACLGVPYFNWGPSYVDTIKTLQDGTYASKWVWLGPDWKDINNRDTSMIGFAKGPALSQEASTNVDKFIGELAGGLNLFTGPLNYQDKSAFLKDGEVATDQQIWYEEQLLEGIEGQSVPSS